MRPPGLPRVSGGLSCPAMSLSAFGDKAHQPSDEAVRAALGPAYALWQEVHQVVAIAAPGVATVWGYTSASTGWGCRLKAGKRVLLYLTPQENHFLVSVALGEKAVASAHARRLPAPLLELLDKAPKYAEGRGIRFPVRKQQDLRYVAQLLGLKLGS